MSESYEFVKIEKKWNREWGQKKTHVIDLNAATKPYYNLMMFPYPSAEGLHMGNMFSYVGSDVHGRFKRAQGYDVFEPMGFDAFGIHSENFALKTGRHPATLIPDNIRSFRRQLQRMGAMFSWDYEVDSTTRDYYRWTQWVFVQLFNKGLAYQKKAAVNWCPQCRTVLAAEQAAGGVCERCNAAVEQRPMLQWFLRTSVYAQRLLDNLEWIDWSQITKTAQERWIGRSEGASVLFSVCDKDAEVEVFTTRPDTLFGATYLVLAPEHPLLVQVTSAAQHSAVEAYVEQARQRTAIERQVAGEKTGIFSGACALHPLKGEAIEIWIADYVLMEYGTGAIMAVPAHDERDADFARVHELKIIQVIEGGEGEAVYNGEGKLINSGVYDGLGSEEAKGQITDALVERNKGRRQVQYRLRDWCISRQRYWGPPIPIIHCDRCGPVAVSEEELPVALPQLADFAPDGSGKSPLARAPGFAEVVCSQCGEDAQRETDVSDNFLDSAWYFFRYPSAKNNKIAFDRELTKKWLPVDMYIGGNEHAVLHLMYTRFLTMAFKDMGLVDFEEPFKRFRVNGMIVKDGAKMSKSRGNVISPDEYLDRFGADALRAYLMFAGNFQEGGDFRDGGIHGIVRFLERVWRYVVQNNFVKGTIEDGEVLRVLHQKIDKVTGDLEALHYNTAIAALMELLNSLHERQTHYREAVCVLLQLLAPFAPFLTQELWQCLGQPGMICDAPWPQANAELMHEKEVEWVVQINGKVRDRLEFAADAAPDIIKEVVLRRERVREWMRGKEVKKVVVVPGKLVNVVVG
ncbi:MAG: leucyl-tRNA synthetase [Planctomycetota bacterium]|jgi:leucyl-tRNA synthetase